MIAWRAMKIDGSVALVTGAGRGLGRAFARELVSRGAARVYGAARDPAAVTEPGVTPVALDVTDPGFSMTFGTAAQGVGLQVSPDPGFGGTVSFSVASLPAPSRISRIF